MLGDWHLYLLALAITIVLYAFLSWLQGPDTVCVLCNGSGLYPDELAVLRQIRRKCPLCVGTGKH